MTLFHLYNYRGKREGAINLCDDGYEAKEELVQVTSARSKLSIKEKNTLDDGK